METLAIIPEKWEQNTIPEYDDKDQERRNLKIDGCLRVILEKENDTTTREILGWDFIPYFWELTEVADDLIDKYRSIILACLREYEINDLNAFNEMHFRESELKSTIKTLDSLVKMGKEIFGDARSSTEKEAEAVSSFVRSKSKIISSKKL